MALVNNIQARLESVVNAFRQKIGQKAEETIDDFVINAQELKIIINQARQTHHEIQGYVERLNVVVEQEIKEYQRMQEDVERIRQSAIRTGHKIDVKGN